MLPEQVGRLLSLLPPEPIGKSASAQRRAGCQGRSEAKSAASLDCLRRCARVRRRSVQAEAGGLLPLVREAPNAVVQIQQQAARLPAGGEPYRDTTGEVWPLSLSARSSNTEHRALSTIIHHRKE